MNTDVLGLEPPQWSRNTGDFIDEEEDDVQDSPELPAPTLTWSTKAQPKSGKFEADLLLVGIAERACAYLRAALSERSASKADSEKNGVNLNASTAGATDSKAEPSSSSGTETLELIGTIGLPEVKLDSKKLLPEAGTPLGLIYRLTDKKGALKTTTLVVLCQQFVPGERVFAWTQTLYQHINAKRSVVLDTMLEGAFQTGENHGNPPPLLRALETSKSKASRPQPEKKAEKSKKKKEKPATHPICGYLEPPNMVSSLSAGLISHCEVYQLPCEVFLSLESPHYVPETMSAFEPVIGHVGLTSFSKTLSGKARQDHFLGWAKVCALPSRSKASTIPEGIFM